MKLVYILSMCFILAACATGYKPHADSSGGYNEWQQNKTVRGVRYAGNSKTKMADALVYAPFRAFEVCSESGSPLAFIIDVKNVSTGGVVHRTFTNTQTSPSTVNAAGFQNGPMTNVSGTVSGGDSTQTTTSYDDPYVLPTIDVYFSCYKAFYKLGADIKAISPEESKVVTSDLMGTVQVNDVDGENKEVLKRGDIITKVNNQRVTNPAELREMVQGSGSSGKTNLTIFREGKIKQVIAKVADGTSWLTEDNATFLSRACKHSDLKDRPICQNR